MSGGSAGGTKNAIDSGDYWSKFPRFLRYAHPDWPIGTWVGVQVSCEGRVNILICAADGEVFSYGSGKNGGPFVERTLEDTVGDIGRASALVARGRLLPNPEIDRARLEALLVPVDLYKFIESYGPLDASDGAGRNATELRQHGSCNLLAAE